MLTNYLKIAWRSILRDRSFSLINIGGLAIGIAACLLILQYVAYERSYDRFHSNAGRIYRVKQDRFEKGTLATEWAAGAFAAGNTMKTSFPEVESYVKLTGDRPAVVEWQERQGKAEKMFFTSADFFHVFSYPLLAGDPQTALAEVNTAVLSESLAKVLFGTEEAMGQTIRINREVTCKVTGVYKEFPGNTHLKSDLLVSFETFRKLVNPNNDPNQDPENAWNWDGCLTYLLLKPGTDAKAMEAKFPAFVAETQPDTKTGNFGVAFSLQPLTDIHLYSHFMEEAELNGDGSVVSMLLGIAFFIIVIAWVNYINLATARAMRRAKEVGVRKVVGSFRWQLIRQFLVESALLNGVSVVVALALVGLALPMFNFFTGQELSFSLLVSAPFWGAMAALYAG
ncbi:MAG TPA: ABC transporter permease, partial [Saprospiraceae bacterium]|nr:ABC transporter permease [Saprospiraceae bacterium]